MFSCTFAFTLKCKILVAVKSTCITLYHLTLVVVSASMNGCVSFCVSLANWRSVPADHFPFSYLHIYQYMLENYALVQDYFLPCQVGMMHHHPVELACTSQFRSCPAAAQKQQLPPLCLSMHWQLRRPF